jgi:cell division protein ZapA (FtsZ GTPase activity inhibitor)
MALQLNLYHEIQKQEQQRRRDPLKLGLLALAVMAGIFVLYYLVRLESAHRVESRLAALKREWMSMEPKCKQAEARSGDLTGFITLSDALTQKMEHRFYWAPVLDQLIQAVPAEVQFTRFDGGLLVDDKQKSAITISGNCVGSEPRKVAEELRTALNNKLVEKFRSAKAAFQNLDDAVESVRLDGKSLPTVSFGIRVEIGKVPADLAVNDTKQNRHETKKLQ